MVAGSRCILGSQELDLIEGSGGQPGGEAGQGGLLVRGREGGGSLRGQGLVVVAHAAHHKMPEPRVLACPPTQPNPTRTVMLSASG